MEWGTLNYYIDRLTSQTPPLFIDVCDSNLTDDDAIRLADAMTAEHHDNEDGNSNDEYSHCGGGGTTLKKLRLRGSSITSRGFLALAEAIGGVAGSTSALEELDVGDSIELAKDVDDFAFGMYLLLSATKLKTLDLEGCYIGRRAGMALSDIIAANGEYLETLNLRNNALEDEAAIRLASRISDCNQLKRLDLGLNYIGPRAAVELAELITSHASLQHLVLFWNSIGDSGARHLAKALRSNTTLRELNLGYNRISSVGLEMLLYAIFDTSSLNALVESNHTLFCLFNQSADDLRRRGCDERMIFDIDNILQLHEMNAMLKHPPNILPDWILDLPLSSLSIEQMKVVIYLTKCFDMRHFLAMDRRMIPQALEFVAANFGYEKVFHLVGHWNMPELFLPQAAQSCQ